MSIPHRLSLGRGTAAFLQATLDLRVAIIAGINFSGVIRPKEWEGTANINHYFRIGLKIL